MKRTWLLAAALCLASCSCNDKGNGPLNETPPGDLAAKGIVIDAPAEGATVTGAWTSVSGWVSRDWVSMLAISGAPVDGFYLPTGHVGVPAVPFSLRADGRFFAPRVPLQDGEVKLVILPFGKGGTYDVVTRTVTAINTKATPATLIVAPAQPEPGQVATLRAATAESASAPFQWDFEGDGTFDAEGTSVTHAWPSSGRFNVIARTKVNGQWVSAFAELTVGKLPEATATAAVGSVTGVFVLPRYLDPDVDALEDADGKPLLETRYVAVTEPDQVRVFDAELNPRFVLAGLTRPSGVATDRAGNLYVADTGADRVVRFTSSGALDPTFGVGGEYRGTTDAPMKAPSAIAYAGIEVLTDGRVLLRCHAAPDYACERDADEYEQAELAALSMTTLTRFAARPEPIIGSQRPAFFIGGGEVLTRELGSFQKTGIRAIDVAPARSEVKGAFVVVDEAGALRFYRGLARQSTWALPFAVKAVGVAPNGRIYVAGDGHLELRAFEPLE